MATEPDWATPVIAIAGVLGTFVTAVATIYLYRVTRLLAVETKRMAKATAQPHIVATLDPNRWSMRHFDLKVDNTGNATAYDISVEFTPPLTNGESRQHMEAIPFKRISVLKPGQGVSSYLSEYAHVEGKSYEVRIRWRNSTASNEWEENTYTLDMTDKQGISELGGDPLVQMANHLKKLKEDLHQITSGSKRLKVDAYTSSDRLHERRVSDRERRRWRAEHAARSAPPATPPEAGDSPAEE